MKTAIILLLSVLYSNISAVAQDSEPVPLSVLADCVAFSGSLENFYIGYRETSGNNKYIEEEKHAGKQQNAWAQILYNRIELEITRKRDMDALNAHMKWVYSTSNLLPDETGLGNAVVIFENRVLNCEKLLRN